MKTTTTAHKTIKLTVWLLSLLENKILALSKLKALEDDDFSEVQIVNFFFDRVKDIVWKCENAGNSIFTFFHDVFKRPLSQQAMYSKGLMTFV